MIACVPTHDPQQVAGDPCASPLHAINNVRKHLSFGFNIHHCIGNRLADLQLHTLWEVLF